MLNNTIEVVMLGYKARSGKDTLANLMATRAQYFPVAFATKLKEMVADLYRFSHDQMYCDGKDVKDDRYKMTPRQVLQQFGQSQRAIYEPIWVEALLFGEVEAAIRAGARRFVITDFRFPNEFQTVLRWAEIRGDVKLLVFKLNRDANMSFVGQDDVSETALDSFTDWDATIDNNGTLDDLWNQFLALTTP